MPILGVDSGNGGRGGEAGAWCSRKEWGAPAKVESLKRGGRDIAPLSSLFLKCHLLLSTMGQKDTAETIKTRGDY